jgi:hypothetical protein
MDHLVVGRTELLVARELAEAAAIDQPLRMFDAKTQ